MRDLRHDAQAIFQAGVNAVLGDQLIRDSVRVDTDCLWLGEICVERILFERIVVVGAGKASGAMAVGLIQALHDANLISALHEDLPPIEIIGHINVPEGCDRLPPEVPWPSHLTLFAARPAGVNEPTAQSIAGTQRILELVGAAGPRDLIVVLISGGGSALLCQPVTGVTLEQKLAVIWHLSGSGADISQLNTVRKHLSDVKGGGLLRAASRADAATKPAMVTLVLSDVLGDPLDLIASGPTVRDTSTAEDALAVLSELDPERVLPESVYRVLSQKAQLNQTNRVVSPVTSTSMPTAGRPENWFEHPVIVVGNNAVAVDGAGIMAESLGYNHVMQSARQSEGAAELIGERLAELTLAMLRRDRNLHRQDALITGGEPVVRLAEVSIRGKGGRNQQLVLAAYRYLLRSGLSEDEWRRLAILSGGTDGEDGPTDAAGAFVDAAVHQRAIDLGLLADDYLARNDAYRFFEQTGGLLITGPTGTNVCDLRVAVVDVN